MEVARMTRKERLEVISMLNGAISMVLAHNEALASKESSEKHAEIFSMIVTMILKDYIKNITPDEIDKASSKFEESFKNFHETVYKVPN